MRLAAAIYVHQRMVASYVQVGSCMTYGQVTQVDPATGMPYPTSAPPDEPVPYDQADCTGSLFTWTLSPEFNGMKKPSWEDPVAALLALGGFAEAAGVLTARCKAIA